jgi:hypothetical protein
MTILLLQILDALVFIGIVLLVGVLIKEFRAYSKKHLFKNEIRLTRGMMVQKEVEIEVAWKVLNKLQAEREGLVKRVEDNVEKISEEKKKTPMDMEVIKKLITENIRLGKTDKRAKNNDIMWAGEILEKDIRIERVVGEITSLVGKREYMKTKLETLEMLWKTGYYKNFEKFFSEELSKDKRLNPDKEENKN